MADPSVGHAISAVNEAENALVRIRNARDHLKRGLLKVEKSLEKEKRKRRKTQQLLNNIFHHEKKKADIVNELLKIGEYGIGEEEG
jgi:prefoldin subunit 5